MSIAMLKQNAEILVEVAENYNKLLERKKETKEKAELERIEMQIKNFKSQFLYLNAAVKKLVDEERKNLLH